MKYKVVLTQPIHEEGLRLLSLTCKVIVNEFPANVSEEEIIKVAKDADAIITRLPRVTRKVIYAAENLKVIGRHGTGYDNIDVKAATERGIPVVYTPYAATESVAEHIIGFIIALSKNIVRADRALRMIGGIGWRARHEYVGREVKGKTLGIIGLGRIGSLTARYAKCLGMKVIYYDVVRRREVEKLLDVEYKPLKELLRISDFISISVPLTETTKKLIGERELKLMKPSAYLINTARGAVVDTSALVKALREGWIAGAALDVFEEEPLPIDHPLTKMENVILTPHMAAHTEEFFREAAVTVAKEVLKALKGERPAYLANPEVYSTTKLRT